jgi:hypothetical protein
MANDFNPNNVTRIAEDAERIHAMQTELAAARDLLSLALNRIHGEPGTVNHDLNKRIADFLSDPVIDVIRVDAVIKYTVLLMEQLVDDGELDPAYLGHFRLSGKARLEAQNLIASNFDITRGEIEDCTRYLVNWAVRNAREAGRKRKARAAKKAPP